MSLISEIRETKDYKTFKVLVTKVAERLNVEKDREEALAMHAGRTSRRLHGKKQYSPKSLLDAALNDLACRSRLVELRVQASLQITLLHDAIKAIRHFITNEFDDDLNDFKTVGQRTALVDRVIKKSLEVESEGKALIELMDHLVGDIDKASYQLKIMSETLKLMMDKPGQTL